MGEFFQKRVKEGKWAKMGDKNKKNRQINKNDRQKDVGKDIEETLREGQRVRERKKEKRARKKDEYAFEIEMLVG